MLASIKILTWSTFNLLHHVHFLLQIIMTSIAPTIMPSPWILNSLLVSDLLPCPLCPCLISSLFAIISDKTTFLFPLEEKGGFKSWGSISLMWNRGTPFRKCSKVLNIIYFLTGVVENSEKYNKPNEKISFLSFHQSERNRWMSLVSWET